MQQLTKKIEAIKNNSYLKNSSINFIGSLLVNVLSYIFNIIIGRVLGPQNYSEYFSLISIWYIATIPAAILQTVVTKNIAYFHHRNNPLGVAKTRDILTRYALIWGSIASLTTIVLIPFLSPLLKISDISGFALIALLLGSSYISAAWLSYFIGKEKYITYAYLSGLGIFVRIITVVIIMFFNRSVTGVLFAMMIGIAIQLSAIVAVFYYETKKSWLPPISLIWQKLIHLTNKMKIELEIKSEIAISLKASLASMFGLALITQMDIIFARIRLSPHEAGLYSSLAVTGKIIPFLTLPLIGVLLPHITGNIAKNQPYKNTLLQAIGLVSLGSGSVAIFYAIYPEFVINMFLGKDYLESAPYLGQFGIFQTLYALVTVGVYASIAMSKLKESSAVALAALFQIVLILVLPPTIQNIIWASIISLTIAVIYYAYTLLFKVNNQAYERNH